MQKSFQHRLFVLFALCLLAVSTFNINGQPIPGQYIAVLNRNVPNPQAVAVGLANQHRVNLSATYANAIRGFAFAGNAQTANAIAQNPQVAYVEQNQIVNAVAQLLTTGVDRADADLVVSIDGIDDAIDADIAIIDTGLDSDHPDLRIDPDGIHFFQRGPKLKSNTNWEDANGHGTHVGGTAAAIDNSIGVVGMAPGARLTAVRVLDQNGNGTVSGVIAGVDWVVARANRFEVANMSLSGGFSQALNDAVKGGTEAGIVFVVAAGNELQNAQNSSPASEPSALTVSAMADFDGQPGGAQPEAVAFQACTVSGDDIWACFSNFGSVIDIAAPGVEIYSTVAGGGYAFSSGTSMASPHVAGAAALYVSVHGLSKTAIGVQGVGDAIKAAGWQAGDFEYFTGDDLDGIAEPLLNLGDLLIPNTAPSVVINSPSDGVSFNSGENILFDGTASDAEDGGLTAALTWNSNIDGSIGGGGNFITTLSDGNHTITAAVTDSGGKTGSASISITVGTPNMAPTVTVTNPADGSTFDSGTPIFFEGSAGDTEDGDLTASLVWTSDIDGPIGTGGSFSTMLSAGTHVVTASVTDSGGVQGTDSITVTVQSTGGGTASVASITYTTEGGKNGDKHLNITVTIIDDASNPLSGAIVSVIVDNDGGQSASGTATTGSAGSVTFQWKNAPSGCFTTTVTDAVASGLTWDGVTPANQFCK